MFVRLNPSHFRQIYQLLQRVDFPHLPFIYTEALPFLTNGMHYGYFKDYQLIFWFCLHQHNNRHYLDLACHPSHQKRWAKKNSLQAIIAVIRSHHAIPLYIISDNPRVYSFVKRFHVISRYL